MSRRRIPPTTRPTHIPNFSAQNLNSSLNPDSEIILPKHVPFPCGAANKSELLNEFIIFIFTLIAASSQFVHLYRSVWWFSDSYTKYTVNFYLIDISLVVFIFVMIGRRMFYCLLIKFMELSCPTKHLPLVEKVIKYSYLAILVVIFFVCNVKIFQNHNVVYIFYLIYPIILYLFIFRCKIDPFLRTNHNKDMPYLGNYEPLHSCSSNANDVRTEVELLRSDFNNRFKQIIFTSVLNAYYATFIPFCFVNKHLYYSTFWVTQHLFFTWISIFTMCAGYCFPIKYCDVLHRAAIHLGQWSRLGPRATHPPPQNWSKTVSFAYGSYVKFSGEIFKSIGYCTSAQPADGGHHRFYVLFKNPSMPYFIISSIQVSIVTLQLILIFYTKEYQYVISIGLLLITNYFTLFRLARDYLIVRSIYNSKSSNS